MHRNDADQSLGTPARSTCAMTLVQTSLRRECFAETHGASLGDGASKSPGNAQHARQMHELTRRQQPNDQLEPDRGDILFGVRRTGKHQLY